MSEVTCPQCGTPQAQDFGIITCPSCGTVLMVDMEGRAQRMGDTASAEPAFAPPEVPQEEYVPVIPLDSPQESSAEQGMGFEAPAEPSLPAIPAQEEYVDILATNEATPEASLQSPQSAFAEIQSFANSDRPTSPLSYTLILEGIDRGDLRRQLTDILSDEKFAFDIDEVLSHLKNGRLEISGLNAVKTSVLVLRLRPLNLKISWRQHVY